MEEELGVALFDRLPSGVRLSTAGEIFVHYARNQIADLERVQSLISDLSGERRGHVSIVCGQAMMDEFMPNMIQRYRADHPGVNFDVRVCNRLDYQTSLNDFSADIALVFEPVLDNDFHGVVDVPQQLHAIYEHSHELGSCDALRLRDCIGYPLALPTKQNSVRHLLDAATLKMQRALNVAIESDNHTLLRQCLSNHNTLGFQIPIGLKEKGSTKLTRVPIAQRDIPAGRLYVGQKKGRTLPVAAARFMEQICDALLARFGT